IVGGLFVLETVSVIVQVLSFRFTGKRIFRMAPLHHHFEQKGWAEPTIVFRFWIIAAILSMIDLAMLQGESYVVLGLARSGLTTVRALLAAGIDCVAWDDDPATRAAAAA